MPTLDEFYTAKQCKLETAHDSKNLNEAIVHGIMTRQS